MSDFSKRQMRYQTAEIDKDIIAFHVEEEDKDTVTEYLVAAIVTKCIIQFGETPEIFD